MPEPKKLYWDSCVFLAYIDDEPDRASNIGALLNEAEEEKVETYTSVVSITEVAFGAAEKSGGRLIEKVEESIRSLWMPASPSKSR
ncbi:type II toxin-antitoxin system VapC family toxin [Rubrobacter indicoceani]|uniref:type II toxin-antitoxin system VapC family toxin n=1 Tax=Rubrobacter indicoceani TaxID=2051957 RepID=UPI0013C4F043|nr:type II toxin-antitoxin system VapC family toxin [Rubrobacter indicoceani]